MSLTSNCLISSEVGILSPVAASLISPPLFVKGLQHRRIIHNVAEAMAPALGTPHQTIDLIQSAATCERHLNNLRQHARNHKVKYTSGKKHALLEDVITRSNSNIQSLKAWTAAITKGRQTSDESIKASINAVFDNIVLRKKDAQKALDHRLELGLLATDKSKCDPVFPSRAA